MKDTLSRAARLAGALILVAAPVRALKTERMDMPRTAAGAAVSVEVVSERAIVRFSPSLDAAARAAALRPAGAAVLRDMPSTGWTLVALPSGMRVASGLAFLRGAAGILEAQPDHAYRLSVAASDPLAASQYHLSVLNAEAAWEYETGTSSRVTIAVIDSGIEGTHPDLSGKLVGTSRYCSPGNALAGGDELACVNNQPPTAACNHATRVAGAAAATANNGIGGAGVSWGAKLLSIKVFDNADCNADCSDAVVNQCATDDWTIANALNDLVPLANTPTYGRIVANMSIGGMVLCNANTALLQTAADNAYAAGIVLIAAAGNHNPTYGVESPANCNHVIPVGATDSSNNLASFSARGSALSSYGFVAPGVGIVTTDINASATSGATGTSFASPIGAGVAALVLSAKPTKTPDEVRDILRGSAVGIGVSAAQVQALPAGDSAGAGLINAFRAMKLANGTLASYEGDQKVIGFPNPFRPSQHGTATISIPTAVQGRDQKVKIYTIDGQLVRDLGTRTTWDGKNDAGNPVASGTYILLVSSDQGKKTGRLAVLR